MIKTVINNQNNCRRNVMRRNRVNRKRSVVESLISKVVKGTSPDRVLSEGFMEPEVWETDFILLDGDMGTDVIPADVVDYTPTSEDEDSETIPDELADYTENTTMYSIEKKHGWVGRLSAPGYLDATEYTYGNTEQEVRDELSDMYGDDEDGDDEDGDDEEEY